LLWFPRRFFFHSNFTTFDGGYLTLQYCSGQGSGRRFVVAAKYDCGSPAVSSSTSISQYLMVAI
jgi:hypothetical protein